MKRIALFCVSIFVLTNLLYPQDIINETGKDGKFIVRDNDAKEALVVDDDTVIIKGELKVETLEAGSVTDKVVVWDNESKQFKAVDQLFSNVSPLSEPLEPKSWHSLGSTGVDEEGNEIDMNVNSPNAVTWNQFDTDYGYIKLGPANTSGYAHIYTDRNKFMFNVPIYSKTGIIGGFGDLIFNTGAVERMRFVQATGFFGMGTTAPKVKFHVVGNHGQGYPTYMAGTMIAAQQNTNGNWAHIAVTSANNGHAGLNLGDVDDDEAGFIRYSNGENALKFGTNAGERMRITSDGKVGIGTTNPLSELSVGGDGYTYTAISSIAPTNLGSQAIYAEANGDEGKAVAGYANGHASFGVIGIAECPTTNCANWGVYGSTDSDNGWAGYFSGRGYFSGNLGVGRDNPSYKLDVDGGNILVRGNDGYTALGHTGIVYLGSVHSYIKAEYGYGVKIGAYAAADAINIKEGSGNVGIGTTTPLGKLDVNGAIYQRGSQIHADYVFEDDYELETIQEHSDFMWSNKHLPAIPKAKKDENGLEIVEVGSHRKGIVEELEKAHIYIAQLEERIREIEELIVNKD